MAKVRVAVALAFQLAVGLELGGEGLVGLTQAFQVAGARSVLGSLWSIGDRATAALMASFYSALSRGASKDVALREAQITLLRNHATAHPSRWAGFVIVGDSC